MANSRSSAPADAIAATADDRERHAGRGASAPAAPVPEYVDFGQPVDNPPPLIELVGFDDAALSVAARQAANGGPTAPLRRRFLRSQAEVPTGAVVGSAETAAPGLPVLIEPTPAPAAPRRPRFATSAVKLPASLWPRLGIAAGCVLALLVVVAVALFARGPASPGRTTANSTAPPPSNPADRLTFYRKAAAAGDAEAQLQLAILYARGEGVTQDYTVAAKWFQAAADQGSARAQYDVGVLYERGRGVAVDLVEATKWYRKAAEANYPLAQYNLAVCYTKGQGIRKDLPEAALWYRRAGLQGMVQAMVNLGTMYERGEGVQASPVDAYAWYLAAGRRGNDAASKRAADVFAAMPKLDQIRAEALASDVGASIHDPKPDRAGPPGAPAVEGSAPGARTAAGH